MSKVTKPLAWCWSFFNRKEEVDGKAKLIFVGYCKFCNAHYTGKPSRMEEHLKNCNKVGTDARKEIDRLSKKPVARRSRSMSPTSKKPKISESAESPRASSGNLKHYFDSTSKNDQEKIDILLTRAFATGNVAPNLLDNPFFKDFINMLKPSYKLPSRDYKYPMLIKEEFERVEKSLEDSCNKADYLAISSDGWTDVCGNNIVNIVVHTPKPFLYDSIDATSTEVDGQIQRTQHTGKFIAKILEEQIVKLGKHKVVAVVTDHAANMKNAWKKLAGEDTERDPEKQYTGKTFDWIIFERCKAHAIDLAAKDICAKTKIAEILKYCVEAAKFVRKKTPELILSKSQVEQSGTSAILQLPVKTRWGTYSKLLSSIVASKDALKFAVCAPGILNDVTLQKEGERLRKMLWESDDFWLDVMDAQKILSPLAEAITSIEGNKVNSRWAYMKIREAFSKSKLAVETSGFLDKMKQEMTEILRNREEFAKSDVAYLLDVLEPSNRGQSLTNYEKQKAIVLLANKLMKNPVFATQKQAVLAEWASWLACTGIFAKENRKYAWDAVNTTDALTWWTAFFSDTLLSKIVQMLHNVPISAAPTERNWSFRGGIHTKLRNRMKVDTAYQVTFIKHNLTLEYKDDFKKARVEQPMEEAEEQETEETNIIENEFDVFMDNF